MKRHIALRRMLWFWLLAPAVLVLFMLAQALAGKYGDDLSIPFNWISAQIFPVLGLLISAVLASPDDEWNNKDVNGNRYLLAKVTSGVQILAIVLTLLIEPLLPATSFDFFDKTIFFFSIWQGVVTACVGGLVFDGR